MWLSEKDVKRFQGKYEIDPVTGCWNWTAAKHPKGYGCFMLNHKTTRATRIAYFLHYGEHDRKLFVCHHCDNPSCVNPKHLFLSNVQGNQRDMANKGRSAHGVRNRAAKLTAKEVLEIRKLLAEGGKQKDIAEKFGVSRPTVNLINRRKIWKHI